MTGVRLRAASVAPLRAGAVHPHATWAVTYTCPGSGLSASRQESTQFPCAVPRFTPPRNGPGCGLRETDLREVPGRLRARVPGPRATEDRESGCGSRSRQQLSADPTVGMDKDAGLADEVNRVWRHGLGREDT